MSGDNEKLPKTAVWCGQEDSNFHGLSPTTTSTLRVYQFRHGRTRLDRYDASRSKARWSAQQAL